MGQLSADSQILDFTAPGPLFGGPPEVYDVRFSGLGLWKPDGSDEVLIREGHEVVVRLGASYPRMMPELIWRTPIFHPNISANGVVCLGGYSTHWVPSLQLDELCTMLWDMIRYANYDVDSPYNRAAAQWTKEQTRYQLPIDHRPLRDVSRESTAHEPEQSPLQLEPVLPRSLTSDDAVALRRAGSMRTEPAEIVFVDDEVIDAEIVPAGAGERAGAEILFIE
jgi:hypothetical protein